MADRATGPVKPPVIELTARSAEARPESEQQTVPPDSPPPESPPPESPPPAAPRAAIAWPLLGGAVVGGAVLGTLLTYLLATIAPLPGPPSVPDLTPAFTAQGEQFAGLADTVTALQQSAGRTQISLDATIAQLDSGLNEVKASLAQVQAGQPAPIDLSPLETQLKTLKAQVDAIASGASTADANVIALSLASLETSVSSLTTRLDGLDATTQALRTDIDAARKTLFEHIDAALPTEVGPALKLPLILSGLEAAFATGKTFQPELDALHAVLPDFAVPGDLANVASTGLTRPDLLQQKFAAALPEILAAHDNTSGDWTQNVVDWGRSLLALRPAHEVEGNSPDAIVSRLEGAMERRDYASALDLLRQLPAQMRDAASGIAADIGVHAEADQLVADLRNRALATTTATP